MPKLKHFDHLGTARFVTFPTYRRQKILTSDVACNAIGVEIAHLRTELGIKVLGYVIMPEHVHLVLLPPDDLELGRIVGNLKGRTARFISQIPGLSVATRLVDGKTKAHIWQYRCYDHNCRTPAATREKIEYCHKNPVLRGLVDDPSQWRWSSYNWYQGVKSVTIAIDGIEVP